MGRSALRLSLFLLAYLRRSKSSYARMPAEELLRTDIEEERYRVGATTNSDEIYSDREERAIYAGCSEARA